ncbi:MAG TPA: NirA family protein [Candidatus Cybelea sp.]|nr:NirA family protein [Candidatus Cybelea sp.]
MQHNAPVGDAFSEEQKQYLQGFLSAVLARGGATAAPAPAPAPGAADTFVAGPEAIHRAAQDRAIAAGGKLVPEEEAKRRKNPFDMWDEMAANGAAGRFPKGTDVFLHKFHGLFYVAPAENAFMCRLRIPNGILSAAQLRGLAEIAEIYCGGFADVTTRANLQLRGIQPPHAQSVLMAIDELGLTSRGAGADNIRNITGSPTAGIDAQELIDTRPLCRALHHYILNHRELYGLPRKFNIAFDGGGKVSVLADTNDIGFAAVRIGAGKSVEPGVYFRVGLGGITGHGDFARDCGILLKPEECVRAAAAMVRVFIDHGDRTDRKKARLKYLLDKWGLDRFLAEAETHFGTPFRRVPVEECEKRGPEVKGAHIGVHGQKQQNLNYIGVVLPVGRIDAARMRGLSEVASRFGSGALRLTVWQNLLISDVPDERVGAALDAIAALGLGTVASGVRSGLVACTGNTGCKFALGDTKSHALTLADALEARVTLDRPINIHLTGCPHSCAQHLIGDIGLLATKIDAGEESVDGYHISVGGSAGAERKLAREIYPAVPFPEVPKLVGSMLAAYLAKRRAGESFHDFVVRHEIDDLKHLISQNDLAA